MFFRGLGRRFEGKEGATPNLGDTQSEAAETQGRLKPMCPGKTPAYWAAQHPGPKRPDFRAVPRSKKPRLPAGCDRAVPRA
jgi:hypothetical protein